MKPTYRAKYPGFLLGFSLTAILLGGAEWGAGRLESSLIPSFLKVHAVTVEGAPPHPFLIWEDPPGTRQEGQITVEINTMGLRGPEVDMPKPARERRLMVLGDGIGFGRGVQAHEALGQVAVDELGGERVGLKAVNGSIPGYSTLQLLNLMELRGWTLEPDVIVVLDNPTDRTVADYVDEEVIPLARLSGGGVRLLEQTALFRVLDYQLGVLHGRHHLRLLEVLAGTTPGNSARSVRLDANARARAVRALIQRAQDHGAGVIFMLTPVPGDLVDAVPSDVVLGRQVLRDASEWSGAKVVEGGEVFAKTGRPEEELWQDGVHPTAFGHRILGRALARSLTHWIRGGTPGGQSRGGALPQYVEPVLESE